MGTAVIGIIILVAVALVIRGIIRDRKAGKLCIGGCAGCPMSEGCDSQTIEIDEELEKKKLL